MRRAGLQTEVLLSLGLVMGLATIVLSGVLLSFQESSLRGVLGRALLAEARADRPSPRAVYPGTAWWWVHPTGAVTPRGAAPAIGGEEQALAQEAAAAGAPLVQPGPIWGPIRFATPLSDGRIAVARLPEQTSWQLRARPVLVIGGIAALNLLVFTGFGLLQLRQRMVRPLERLVAAAREVEDGGAGVRAPTEGPREIAQLGIAFNEMNAALEQRSGELEKAVAGLRDANADLRRARDGLDRAERLASVGRLAAGVAHEVGNPIGALLGFVGLVQRDEGLSPQSREHLDRAAVQGQRVRGILRQLLDFSRPPRSVPVPLDLHAAAQETQALLAAQRRYDGISFAVEREAGVGPALGDASAVGQILLNLMLNAADAVAGVEAPRVELRVRPAVLGIRAGDDPAEAAARRVPDGIECVVADNGSGIAPEDLERVFDPFFTTKPPGEGTGLGLANAARLAEELGGAVTVVAAPDGMTTAIALRLPAVRAPAADGETRRATQGAA